MTLEEKNICEGIDTLIKQEQSFAIYCAPGENKSHFLTQTSGSIRLIYDIEELNELQGFVIAPFRVNQDCPIVLIQPDRLEVEEWRNADTSDKTPERSATFRKNQHQRLEDYTDRFNLFSEALRKKEFDKLVLSRSFTLDKKDEFSPAKAFYRASKRYIYSYVYLCYTPQTGVWLGSTPEIILSGEQGEWNTTALAGTQSLHQGELPINWDEKNKEEQTLVAAYIRQQLLSMDIHSEEKGPYAVRAGELSHLKTDFHFHLSGTKKLGSMLKLLHPTPAVCGLPKEKAYQFILENEGYNRSYYSGFIGLLNPTGKTDLYVNLRCMNIDNDTLTLYAGGGLLASSNLEDEWNETENKLQTMLAITDN
ncbi:MAG: putative isochorismate synthase [Bacteroidetes bacterium]|nr:putative isochorismate synthase [Bacteroidota bacterium]